MQAEPPWNIAGIPPEAREAARAAARREGLSVGEWLTRRITPDQRSGAEDSHMSGLGFSLGQSQSVLPPNSEASPAARDSEGVLARIPHSEGKTEAVHKAVDEQLKAAARRFEAAERNQTEKNRAMSQAATQMNVAVREQAQALEQIATNLSSLAARLARLERHAAQDGMKEAVKALHQGLSRVADRIAQMASQSASQIALLTGNLDSLATRVTQTHDGIETAAQALDEKLALLDERVRVVERTAFSSASALDHTMENLEQLRAAQDSANSDGQCDAAALTQLKTICDGLNVRIAASESQGAAAIARLEEGLVKLESKRFDDPLERRLQGIEDLLSGIVTRIDQAERSSTAAADNVEQALGDLSASLEAADSRNRKTVEQLKAEIESAAGKIAAIEGKIPGAYPGGSAEPILDMPMFQQPSGSTGSPAAFTSAPPFSFETDEQPPLERADPAPAERSGEPPDIESAEPYVAAARRAAHAAALESEIGPRASMGGFAWTFTGLSENKRPREGARHFLMAGSIFGVAIAAALTGVVLTRGAGAPPAHAPASIIASAVSPAHDFARAKPAKGLVPEASNASVDASSPRLTAPPQIVVTTSSPPNGTGAAAAAKNVPDRFSVTSPNPRSSTRDPAFLSAPAPADSQSGLQKLTILARTGDSKAELLLGLQYLGNGTVLANEAEAARWLARAAQQGEPFAQYRLGTLYERGRGVPRDARQATHWYELAAKQGNRKAMHNLAIAFAEGTGAPKNPVQAAMWFARAANLGLADSQFNLAVLYERGMGVHQSLVDAYKWYLIAAAQGDAESKTRADALATQLNDTDRNAAQRAAAAFMPQEPNPAANTAPILG